MSNPDPLTSAHWPSGWSRARLVNSTSSDLLDLPNSERDTMYDSLRQLLGPDGFKSLLDEMSANYKARLSAADDETVAAGADDDEQLPPHLRAPFLATLSRLYQGGDGGDGRGMGTWGFVVYRLVAYGDDEDGRQWAAFREKWDGIVRERMANYEGVPGVAQAMRCLEFRWVEDRGLEGASWEAVASHYRDLLDQQQPALAPGLAHPLCLAITSSALSSVLSTPPPAPPPGEERRSIPFAVAVDKSLGESSDQDAHPMEEEEERAGLEEDFGTPRVFKVAVESLLSELFPVMGGDVMAPRALAVGVGPRQVWVSSAGRHGVFEIGE